MDYVREAFFSMIGDYRRGTVPSQVEQNNNMRAKNVADYSRIVKIIRIYKYS